MSKRSVVVGSQTGGLSGVDNDARAFAERLRERDFAVDLRLAADASRAGMLEAMERLIRDSQRGDAAVFYYSGHGAYFQRSATAAAAPAAIVQCLVPSDWERSDEFCGLLDIELSLLLKRLTDKTENVTVVLDCCHSSRMMRQAALPFQLAKVVTRAWDARLDAHLRKHRWDPSTRFVECNPHAVRIAAAEQDAYAYEGLQQVGPKSLRMGNLTYALVQSLDEARDTPLSWRALMARVRELVIAREASQRPELAGPRSRLLFSEEHADVADLDPVVFFVDGHRPAVRAGRLLGAVPSATVYDILPRSAASYTPEAVVARAVVTDTTGTIAHVELSQVKSPGPLPGDFAIPVKAPFSRTAVEVLGGERERAPIEALLTSGRYLVAGTSEDSCPLRVRANALSLELIDDEDGAIVDPLPNTDAGRAQLVRVAERFSRALAVRNLQGYGLPEGAIEVTWGRVEGGRRVPMPPGERLHVSDFIYVEVVNKTPAKLWVGVLDLGITGNVSLLSESTPQGRILQPAGQAPADRFTLGEEHGQLVGLGPLSWATDGPTQASSRPECLVVIACEDEADFMAFETPSNLRARGERTGLTELFDSLRDGRTREVPKSRIRGGYCVRRLPFELVRTTRAAKLLGSADLAGRGVSAASGRREERTLAKLKQSDLLPGDVLLSLGGSVLSEGIRGLDGGWYSHAALWTGSDVIESILQLPATGDPKRQPGVVRRTLEHSIETGGRHFVDVYRHTQLSDAQRSAVVEHAATYLGRTYGLSDLLLGATIISSGSFLFRTSDRAQRTWLHAMNLFVDALSLDVAQPEELVTCSELVARCYLQAGAALRIDISGLRVYRGAELRATLLDLARRHLPLARGGEHPILSEVHAFQDKLAALRGREVEALLPSFGPQPRALATVVRAGEDWSANLVTPRDLMQSRDLELVGSVHP